MVNGNTSILNAAQLRFPRIMSQESNGNVDHSNLQGSMIAASQVDERYQRNNTAADSLTNGGTTMTLPSVQNNRNGGLPTSALPNSMNQNDLMTRHLQLAQLLKNNFAAASTNPMIMQELQNLNNDILTKGGLGNVSFDPSGNNSMFGSGAGPQNVQQQLSNMGQPNLSANNAQLNAGLQSLQQALGNGGVLQSTLYQQQKSAPFNGNNPIPSNSDMNALAAKNISADLQAKNNLLASLSNSVKNNMGVSMSSGSDSHPNSSIADRTGLPSLVDTSKHLLGANNINLPLPTSSGNNSPLASAGTMGSNEIAINSRRSNSIDITNGAATGPSVGNHQISNLQAASLMGMVESQNKTDNQAYMETLQRMIQKPNNGVPTTNANSILSASLNTGNGNILPAGPEVSAQPPKGDAQTQKQQNDSYRDFSKVSNDGTDFSINQQPGKEPPFPVKLHRILSNSEYNDMISWLPHGRSWRVLKPKAFEETIIPLYFRHAKYASFMRQVNGWGFKRMTQGPDHNSYYHELFLRGMPHLCYKMRRPTRIARVDTDPDYNPDFYRLSAIAPLPNQGGDLIGAASNGGNANGLQGRGQNPSTGLQNPGLSALGNLAGMGNIRGINNLGGNNALTGLSNLAGMNNLNGLDGSLAANALLQQQLQGQNLNIGQQLGQQLGQQVPGVVQNQQNAGNNFGGLQNGASELSQLEALRQRRKELVRQLQFMVEGGNNIPVPAPSSSAGNVLNNNPPVPQLPGNISSLLTSNLGANAFGAGGNNTTSQLQQMLSLGMGGSTGQRPVLPNPTPSGQSTLENLSNSLANGALGGINPQLLMQNSFQGGGLNTNSMNNSLGLTGGVSGNQQAGLGLNNEMAQNLGMMLQNNQFMGQTNFPKTDPKQG